MITKDNIYPGARVVYDDPEYPSEKPIKGTVTYTEPLGEGKGPLDYIIYFLPDKEFEEQVADNNKELHGLQILLPGMASLLPPEEIITRDPPHVLESFEIKIDIEKKAKGNDLNDKINDYYEDILTMLTRYGFDIIAPTQAIYAPEARKGQQRIYCHYMVLSGECRPSEFSALERMLRFGKSFEIKLIYKEKMFDYTAQEELVLYNEINNTTIVKKILQTFDAKGEETYKKPWTGLLELAKAIKIKTIHNYMFEGNTYPNYIFVKNTFDIMMEQGMFDKQNMGNGENTTYVRSAITLKTLSHNGELLCSIKDRSHVSDDMYLTAANNCNRILHIFPEHLKTDDILSSFVCVNDTALQFIERRKRTPTVCMQAINTHFAEKDVKYPALMNMAIRYLQTMGTNPNNDKVNNLIHQYNFQNIAFLIGDETFEPISKQERKDIINMINTSEKDTVFRDLPDSRKTEVVSSFAISMAPDNLGYIPDKQLSENFINKALLYNGTAILQLNPERINYNLCFYALEHCHENDIKSVEVFKLSLKTEQSSLLALQKSIYALEYISPHYINKDSILAAINSCRNEYDWKFLQENNNPKVHILVLQSKKVDPLQYLQSIPSNIVNEDIANTAIRQNRDCIRYIAPEIQTTAMIVDAIANHRDASILTYENLNQKLLGPRIYKLAIGFDPDAFRFIPENCITPELCMLGAKYYPDKLEHISSYFPQAIKESDNIYTFNLRIEKDLGCLTAKDTVKLYKDGTVNAKTIKTSSGELHNQLITYDRISKKIYRQSVPKANKSKLASKRSNVPSNRNKPNI